MLRSVAGDRAYRWLNAGRLEPRGIAAFLILDGRFPRSLVFSYEKLASNLAGLARQYGRETSAHELLHAARAKLQAATIERIFEGGLHEFITDFIAGTNRIDLAIAAEYRFVV